MQKKRKLRISKRINAAVMFFVMLLTMISVRVLETRTVYAETNVKFDDTKTATELVNSLTNSKIKVNNVNSDGCVRLFSNGYDELGISNGISLDTSDAATGTIDPDLEALIKKQGEEYYEGSASTVKFEMTATGNLLNFNYVFASSEFDEPPQYNDIFALFVSVNDGPFENIAVLDDGSYITISSLKNGGSENNVNDYYSKRDMSFIVTEYDEESVEGVSKVFNAKKEVNKGDKVVVKFAIADVGDAWFDSYVFIESKSLNFESSDSTSEKIKIDGVPIISGIDKPGQILTVDYEGNAKESCSYQWYADGNEISGAASETYVLTEADKGKKITVKAIGIGDYYGEVISEPISVSDAAERCRVKFDTNGGSKIEDVEVEKGNTITLPSKPSKAKYTFKGWYTDEKCTKGKEFTSSTLVDSDITVYAKWQKNSTSSSSSHKRSKNISEKEQLVSDPITEEKNVSEKQVIQQSVSKTPKGWVKDADEKWYYFNDDGKMKEDWFQDPQDRHWYLLETGTGIMKTGWQYVEGKWYYLNPQATELMWVQDSSGYWTYTGGNGKALGEMYANEETPDGYMVGADGSLI